MKKALLAALLVIIFSVGCGNGNPTVPQPNDLSDFAGAWLVNITLTGDLGTDRITPIYWITKNTVSQDSDNYLSELAWHYNGSTLNLSGTITYNVEKWSHGDHCKECSVRFTIEVPLSSGDQLGFIEGNGIRYCCEDEDNVDITGSMTAWNNTMI